MGRITHNLTFCFTVCFEIGFLQTLLGFPDSSVGKESACNAGDPGSIPDWGRFAGKGDRLPVPVFLGFPCGSAGKEFTCNVWDLGLILGLGRSPGGEKGYPLQYSGEFWTV